MRWLAVLVALTILQTRTSAQPTTCFPRPPRFDSTDATEEELTVDALSKGGQKWCQLVSDAACGACSGVCTPVEPRRKDKIFDEYTERIEENQAAMEICEGIAAVSDMQLMSGCPTGAEVMSAHDRMGWQAFSAVIEQRLSSSQEPLSNIQETVAYLEANCSSLNVTGMGEICVSNWAKQHVSVLIACMESGPMQPCMYNDTWNTTCLHGAAEIVGYSSAAVDEFVAAMKGFTGACAAASTQAECEAVNAESHAKAVVAAEEKLVVSAGSPRTLTAAVLLLAVWAWPLFL